MNIYPIIRARRHTEATGKKHLNRCLFLVFLYAALPALGALDVDENDLSAFESLPVIQSPAQPDSAWKLIASPVEARPLSLIPVGVQPSRRLLLRAILLCMLGTIAIRFLLVPVGLHAPPDRPFCAAPYKTQEGYIT